jgi:hypothetical protein
MADVGMGKSTHPRVRPPGDIGNHVRKGPAVARVEGERNRLKRPRAVGPDAALGPISAFGPTVLSGLLFLGRDRRTAASHHQRDKPSAVLRFGGVGCLSVIAKACAAHPCQLCTPQTHVLPAAASASIRLGRAQWGQK